MYVRILHAMGSSDFDLFKEGVIEFALNKVADLSQLQIDHPFLESLRIPQGQANSFTIDLHLLVVVCEVLVASCGGRWSVIVGDSVGLLLSRESERGSEEVDERRLARTASAYHKDVEWSRVFASAYLSHCQSNLFIRSGKLTLLGLFMELTREGA